MTNKRLLILSCAARKSDAEFCRAIDRYQSPAFFLVRRFLKLNPETKTVIWILSGKYGLIAADNVTVHYEQAMTVERAEELKYQIAKQFKYLFERNFRDDPPEYVFGHLPATYQKALEVQLANLRNVAKVDIAKGQPGKKLQQMKNWLQKENR